MKTHIVKQGECLSSIAHRFGFKTARLLYEHPDNAEFRKKRPDPAVIFPGDEIKIPDLRPQSLTLQTGKTHRIVVNLPVVQLRVYLRDLDGVAIANQDYVIRFEGCKEKGKTTDKGLLEHKVPASIDEAEVEIPCLGLALRLRCGRIDPIDTVTGFQVRLNNLGFGAGAADGVLGPRTRAAIRRFQESCAIKATGDMDTQTGQKLAQTYGC
jgi:hypothetical protein